MKDAYWLRHDTNAKDDPKNVMLIEQLGLEGYGIFWVLNETLREQTDYKLPLKIVPALARRYNTSAEKMLTVIRNYDLYQVEDEIFFFSPSLIRRMEQYDQLKNNRREAANKRWKNKELGTGTDANAMQVQCNINASAMQVQSMCNANRIDKNRVDKNRIEEIKEEKKSKRFTPPSIFDVQIYLSELTTTTGIFLNAALEAEKFEAFYSSKGWYVGKNKMVDWKAAARNWIKKSENTPTAKATSGINQRVNLF